MRSPDPITWHLRGPRELCADRGGPCHQAAEHRCAAECRGHGLAEAPRASLGAECLRPLLLDNVAAIQQSAALALGRLANFSPQLAESVGPSG